MRILFPELKLISLNFIRDKKKKKQTNLQHTLPHNVCLTCRIIIRICVVYPAERNRFTGDLIMRIIQQTQKTSTNEEIDLTVVDT